MDIQLFRDLERLRNTGNFSQAAALANLSQPAFSRRIKALEAWVGATLVDRSRQPARLTVEGEQILEAGLVALAHIEHERSQIRELQSLPDKYVVTFAAQHSIGWRFYPAWLQALEEGHGPIMSRLRAEDLANCIRALRGGEADFVIAYESQGVSVGKGLESVAIGADQLIPVCKPDADGRPLFAFTAPGVPMPYLRFGPTAPIVAHLARLFESHKLESRLETVYENSMAGALRMRARSGEGVAWLPRSLVQPDFDAGLLVDTGDPSWSVDLTIRLFREPARTNGVTRSIWSFLKVREPIPLAPTP